VSDKNADVSLASTISTNDETSSVMSGLTAGGSRKKSKRRKNKKTKRNYFIYN
jgi:hypothetical protein